MSAVSLTPWAGGSGNHGCPTQAFFACVGNVGYNHSLEVEPYKNPTRAKEARVGHPAYHVIMVAPE